MEPFPDPRIFKEPRLNHLTALSLTLLSASALAACSLDEPSDDGGSAATGNTAALAGSGGKAGTTGQGGTTNGGSSGAGGSGTGGATNGGAGGTSGSSAVGGSSGTGTGTGGATAGTGGSAGVGGSLAGSAGTGGSVGGAAGSGTGGAGAAGMSGSAGSGGSSTNLGTGTMTGTGSSSERYATVEVTRNDQPYILITNGWGPGFGSHTVSWEGTSFVVESMEGEAGTMGQPASYPSVFCGKYSVMQVPDCGLPAPIDTLTSLRTGWRWAANGNMGEYNAAYDIWLGNGTQLQGYLMVWLRDPANYQPAGSLVMTEQGVTVANVPGVWNIWSGMVNRLPITNWVRAESTVDTEIEFDVMDFVRDAETRGLSVPGTHVNAVAVGFEIWEGPIANLESVDFYVDVN